MAPEFLGGRSEFLINEFLNARKRFLALQKGLHGEGAVYYELAKLPDGYSCIQDIIPFHLGNIDFVIVGPTGIFSLEVKNWEGRIGSDGKNLLLNGAPMGKDALRQAYFSAMKVRHALKLTIGKDYFVKPILVFAKSKMFDIKEKEIHGVTVLPKWQLTKFISTQKPRTIDINEIKKVLAGFHIPTPVALKAKCMGFIGGHVNLCKHIADLDIHEA